jgi:hypothetical protein
MYQYSIERQIVLLQAGVLVPKGLNEGSQAFYCLEQTPKTPIRPFTNTLQTRLGECIGPKDRSSFKTSRPWQTHVAAREPRPTTTTVLSVSDPKNPASFLRQSRPAPMVVG